MEQQKTFAPPVDWDELYPGRFLKAGEFKGKKPTLTISQVKIEELVGDKGPQIKGVIRFERTDKEWALNKTNGICLKDMFGRKVQEWVGKRVTLFAGTWDGEECIRVWGSPDLPEDREVTIQLPRKRPFKMVMHRVTREAPAAAPPAEHVPFFSDKSAIDYLKTARGAAELDSMWREIIADYRSSNRQLPLDVEAFYNDRRDSL